MTSKVIKGHIRPLLCQNHSSTFVYGPILMKICMNAKFFIIVTFMLWRSFLKKFTLRPSDLNLMETFVLVFISVGFFLGFSLQRIFSFSFPNCFDTCIGLSLEYYILITTLT